MDKEQYQRVKEIFLAVLARPGDPSESSIDELCGNDDHLKKEVRSLIQAHGRAEVSGRKLEVMTAETQPDSFSDHPGGTFASMPHLTGTSNQSPAAIERGTGAPRSDTHSHPRSRLHGRARFAPGTIIAERYRIAGLLGAGGMGEVYRADDLTLDQPVALKFLPQVYSSDPAWLARFHNEVRLARQVTHPNVCRVFDIGQVDGEQFISMEFVDGEDLASLLRRIGRLPRDKAVQISRQLCAALAAAHDRGVLHRDLKPANVMLDGRGDVRITDFGISAAADGKNEAVAGTPAYMSPEQFKGAEATARSDIYSLGLVLYEVFTGRPVFAGGSLLEYARAHRATQPTNPSTIAQDMDPIVERLILRCLEKDPAKRPPSAMAVAAALPGGDPLAAALALGETPSPELVAASGGNAALRPVVAGAFLLATLIGLVAIVLLARRAFLLPRAHFDKAPAVLDEKARDVLADMGLDKPLLAKASGFAIDPRYTLWVQKHATTSERWDKLASVRPGIGLYWYRESPRYMISHDDTGLTTLDEPARTEPGMRTVCLDVLGRLKLLEIIPDPLEHEKGPTTQPEFDPMPLFKAAGLDMAAFQPVESRSVPPVFADQRLAWRGTYPDNPSQAVRVELATLQGKPVYFALVEDWMDQTIEQGSPRWQDITPGDRFFRALLILVVPVSGMLMAWRNMRAKRGDVSGAYRLAVFFLVLGLIIWALSSTHVPELLAETRQFMRALGFILIPAAIVWIFYLAMEPYVRRIWPETVISWTRLLTGRVTDPLVMSHVLTGLAMGTGLAIVAELGNLIPMWLGHAPPFTPMMNIVRFLASNNAGMVMMLSLLEALYIGLLYLLVLVLLQLVLRRRWLAGMAFILAGAAMFVPWRDAGWSAWIVAVITSSTLLCLLVRYGLVSALAGLLVVCVVRDVPITPELSIWYGSQTIVSIGTLMVLAVVAAALAIRGSAPHRAPESDGTRRLAE